MRNSRVSFRVSPATTAGVGVDEAQEPLLPQPHEPLLQPAQTWEQRLELVGLRRPERAAVVPLADGDAGWWSAEQEMHMLREVVRAFVRLRTQTADHVM